MTPENIDKVHDNVLADRQVKVRQLAEAVGISIDRVHFIFYFELLPHPAYSPDLAPSDFQLFWKLKTFLGEYKFVCNEKAIYVVNDYFEDLKENYFREGIGHLEKSWTKCVELWGDYVGK